jgi:CheY-like chemotaxis protein
MLTHRNRTLATILMALTMMIGASNVLAQFDAAPAVDLDQDTPQGDEKLADLWADFIHYIKIARADLARSYGQAVLQAQAEPREIYQLAQNTANARSVMVDRGAKLEGMEPIIEAMLDKIEQGFEQVRKDPEEIEAAINRLGGSLRAQEIGAQRLIVSGQYALPQMIQRLRDEDTPRNLRENIINVLPRMGKEAVRPLSVALQADDAALLETLADVLADIEYPHSAPRLKELAQREGVLDRVKTAANRALLIVAGREAARKSVAELYYDLATSYYYDAESIRADERYDMANVWYWQDDLGLVYRPVPRPIFNEIYAMRMARLALEHNAEYYPAVSLWVAANLKRQAELPEGAVDPTYGEDQPTAAYYALASGTKYLQDVLARALRDRDTAVAFGAINALARTSGAQTLVQPVAGGAQPLVEALAYPDRVIRYLAAVSLANALPKERFTGCNIVPVVLNDALRQSGSKVALLVMDNEETRNQMKDKLRGAGYEVTEAAACDAGIAAAHRGTGVDVVVLGSSPSPADCISSLRQDVRLAAKPVVVAYTTESLRELAQRDKRIVLVDADVEAAQLAEALDQAATLGVGSPMTPEAATMWAVRAAQAIERLADTNNPVFDLAATRPALIAALDDPREPVKLAAAEALAVMDSAEAQQALAAQAVNAELAENVRVAAFDALTESLRRFGNQLTDQLAGQVLDVVTGEGSDELKNSAAQALGAMDLPSEQIQSLIVKAKNQ